jgi:hypothetical protein
MMDWKAIERPETEGSIKIKRVRKEIKILGGVNSQMQRVRSGNCC